MTLTGEAMRSNKTQNIAPAGMDRRLAPLPGAGLIQNMKLDEHGYWSSCVGVEPLIISPGLVVPNNRYSTQTNRLFTWNRRQGAEVYVLEAKDDGSIVYQVSNVGEWGRTSLLQSTQIGYHLVAEGRSPRRAHDPGEQFVPHSRFLLILNGKDVPLKFWGRDHTEYFGFTTRTPQPEILSVDTDYFVGDFPNNKPGTVSVRTPELLGLGKGELNSVNTYRYRISFITNTGSESPLSDPVEVTWINEDDLKRHAVFIQDLPIGPPGTLARRVYRTRNVSDYTEGEVQYFFLTEIQDNISRTWTDTIPDSLLTALAPSATDSIVLPTNYRYGASWDGRIWLAGGIGSDERIRYSQQAAPEQFPAFNYFDVGNTNGGAITALHPYYQNLLVFREHSIQIITKQAGSYQINTLSTDIGTEATNTIVDVPGFGVVFLARNGVYSLTGGTSGGSITQLKKLSDTLGDLQDTINPEALTNACAAYSNKESEYWVGVPTKGNDRPNQGWVLHNRGLWSLRTLDLQDINVYPTGEFLMTRPVDSLRNLGVQVWCGSKLSDTRLAVQTGVDNSDRWVSIQGNPLESVYESTWLDFGDEGVRKQILYVELMVLEQGLNKYTLTSAVNWRDFVENPEQQVLFDPETYDAQPVDSQGTPVLGNVETGNTWGGTRRVQIRFDVHTGQAYLYKFRIASEGIFKILGYKVHYSVNNTNKVFNSLAGE